VWRNPMEVTEILGSLNEIARKRRNLFFKDVKKVLKREKSHFYRTGWNPRKGAEGLWNGARGQSD